MDMDLNFSKWILDHGFNFFHGFGYGFGLVISNGFGYGFFSKWIWTWIWISFPPWIGSDFGSQWTGRSAY